MMKLASAGLGLVVASTASAAFTGFDVSSSSSGGYVTYRVSATFDGATDTVLNAFQIHAVQGDMTGFYHNDFLSGGSVSSVAGTWNPTFSNGGINDSFVTIGGGIGPISGNTTSPDPGWANGWNIAGIPDTASVGIAGWYNSLPPNNQGRADASGKTLLAQFVLADGHALKQMFLKIGYNNGVSGSPVLFGEGTFTLGVPTPGAIALLGLAGLAGRRRR